MVFFTAFGDRIITFKEPVPNKVLKGYVIGRERVPNEGSCRVSCYLNPDCVSINMGPLTEGELTCELNKATSGNEYSSHLENQKDHTYLEIEVISKISPRVIKMMTLSIFQIAYVHSQIKSASYIDTLNTMAFLSIC